MQIAYYGLSANPPTWAHKSIIHELSTTRFFDLVIVSVCGPRDDKSSSRVISNAHRAALVTLGFPGLPDNTILDVSDLGRMSDRLRTSTWIYLRELQEKFSHATIWCVVGSDLVAGGQEGSEICKNWIDGRRLWTEFPFVIVPRPNYDIISGEVPTRCRILSGFCCGESSSDIRKKISAGDSIDSLVVDDVANYIRAHDLYREPTSAA